MKLDNSAANAFQFCPQMYQEKYVLHIQKRPSGDARDFGKRIHEYLAKHFDEQRGGLRELSDVADEQIENEVIEMYEAYAARYPEEDFDVVEVEEYFEVPLPPSEATGVVHTYCGKRDGVVRSRESGRLRLLEHKSEARNARSNLPKVWAARAQVGLYLFAAEQRYQERFDDILLDVLTRRSPAGRCACGFRRDNLQRTPVQIEQAVRDIIAVADKIEEYQARYGDAKPWPSFTENCCKGGFDCEFYNLHILGQGERNPQMIERYYCPTEDYLGL